MRKARLGSQGIEREAERLKTLLTVNKGVAVYNSSAITIANSTWTGLTFNSERWDDASFHSTVANTGRLTVPSEYGDWYIISGHVQWDSSGGGSYRRVAIRLNGTTYIALQEMGVHTTYTLQSLSTMYYLAAADYVELMVNQDSGGNLDVLVAGNYTPEFRMMRI